MLITTTSVAMLVLILIGLELGRVRLITGLLGWAMWSVVVLLPVAAAVHLSA
ncbi:hypothetical protein Q4F19_07700 [Sphingomonas sp. BIUV-7]|uniref:Uncharacterized protein n=1 Tax=Sphingomonas natans TaxID=3063330 RepID=A0ABT8Y7H1_9SPHN|nr:hypothetical protein [Sphingomonas sp. BIUV-7]MDO6414263.1 hypothetical protein [Sphingomonas sp. BIUV-7]